MQDLVPRRRQRYLLRQPTNPNPLSCSSEEALQKEQPTGNQNKALLVSFVNHGSFGQRPLTLGEKEKNALSLSQIHTHTHTHSRTLSLRFLSSRLWRGSKVQTGDLHVVFVRVRGWGPYLVDIWLQESRCKLLNDLTHVCRTLYLFSLCNDQHRRTQS